MSLQLTRVQQSLVDLAKSTLGTNRKTIWVSDMRQGATTAIEQFVIGLLNENSKEKSYRLRICASGFRSALRMNERIFKLISDPSAVHKHASNLIAMKNSTNVYFDREGQLERGRESLFDLQIWDDALFYEDFGQKYNETKGPLLLVQTERHDDLSAIYTKLQCDQLVDKSNKENVKKRQRQMIFCEWAETLRRLGVWDHDGSIIQQMIQESNELKSDQFDVVFESLTKKRNAHLASFNAFTQSTPSSNSSL